MDRGYPHNLKEKLLSKIKLTGSVHTCCPGTVGPSAVVAELTNMNTSFFQVPTLEFGHGAGARVQGLNLFRA